MAPAPDASFGDNGDDLNEDWIKTRTWDLPTDIDALEQLVGTEMMFKLLTLPAGLAMPSDLRTAIEARQANG